MSEGRDGALRWALLAALVVAQACDWAGYRAFRIPTGSMQPTVDIGDTVLVRWYGRGKVPRIERGEVIVFHVPYDHSELHFKRAVAVAGDTVEIANGELIVNGRPVPQAYGHASGADNESVEFPSITVPPATVFVLGDYWAASADSREYGPISVEAVEGKWFE